MTIKLACTNFGGIKLAMKLASVPPHMAAELLAMASRGRRPLPISAITPMTPNGHTLQSLVGHRPAPMPVSAVRNASTPAGAAQVLTPGVRTTAGELGAALRLRHQARGAQELASAMGHTPVNPANPFMRAAVPPPPKLASLSPFSRARR